MTDDDRYPVSADTLADPCPECGGQTIEFRANGLDSQYKVCSRFKEPGHLSEREMARMLADFRRAMFPSGRWA